MREFAGKTAVVTGAASGIGRALAERFASADMQVVLADIEQEALEAATKALEQQGRRVIGVVTDTMQRGSIEALAQRALDAFGTVHVLCNNAGVASRGDGRPVWEVPADDWSWVLGVNFQGVLWGIQIFLPHMLEHGEEGHVVNTASLAGVLPSGGSYGVSKHGVLALTETLYRDLKQIEAKIGASVLCPGFVNTRILEAERNRPSELGTGAPKLPDEARAAASAMLQQGMDPGEVADIVFRSIEEDRCYILPHPAWDDMVRSRVEHILARGAPMQMDFAEMLRRRAAGERF